MGRPIPEIEKEALDGAFMEPYLQLVISRRYGDDVSIQSLETAPIKRGVFRYRIQMNGTHSEEPPLSIIGKVFDEEDAGKAAFDKMRQLWESGFPENDPLRVRIPYAFYFLSELRLLLMEAAPGTPLKKLVKKQKATAADMTGFAETLAKLHSTALAFGEPFTVEKHLSVRCGDLVEPMATEFPEIGEDLRGIVDAALKYQSQNTAQDFTLAHGDFHLSQVHAHHDDLWLLDIDPLHFGDPAYDVAMVLFMLKQESAKRGTGAYINSLRDVFIDTYFSKMNWEIARRIPLQEAMINLKRACKRYRWQDEDGWQEILPKQVQQAVTCMEAMGKFPALENRADLVEIYEHCPGSE